MDLNKYTACLILASMLNLNAALAASNFSYQQTEAKPEIQSPKTQSVYYGNEPLRGSVVMVPAGASMQAVLTSSLSSETANTGDYVNMHLNNDFVYNGKIIAPAGSSITGTVIQVSKAKHGSMNGRLCVRFTQLITPTETIIPISAVIKTDDSTGILVGGTKMDVTKEYAKDLAVGSAAGALSGLVFGALASGDKLGRGVALGTAVGAGGGLAKSVWDKGKDVEIPANAQIDLLITQPITTSASNYSYEN